MANKVLTPAESFTDFIGQEVRVGDHVVYATIDGRSPVQKYAEVVKIEWMERDYYAKAYLRVGVREISNGRGFERWDTRVYDENWKRVGDKPARVTYPMRENIVLVRPS